MHALLYRSSARPGLLALDINDIIDSASSRNVTMDVTGLLLHGHLESVAIAPGEFVQWLEGPQESVESLYTTITADSRHSQFEVLGRGSVTALTAGSGLDLENDRLFPGWAMGLLLMSELPATLYGFLQFVSSRRDTDLEDSSSRVLAS